MNLGELGVLLLFLGAFCVVFAVIGGLATLGGSLLAAWRNARDRKRMVIRRRQAWLEECERVRPVARRQK